MWSCIKILFWDVICLPKLRITSRIRTWPHTSSIDLNRKNVWIDIPCKLIILSSISSQLLSEWLGWWTMPPPPPPPLATCDKKCWFPTPTDNWRTENLGRLAISSRRVYFYKSHWYKSNEGQTLDGVSHKTSISSLRGNWKVFDFRRFYVTRDQN